MDRLTASRRDGSEGRRCARIGAGILCAFASAKLLAVLGILAGRLDAQTLLPETPVWLVAGLGIGELVIAILILRYLNARAGCLLIAVVGTLFLAYRLFNAETACPCTGGLMSFSAWLQAQEGKFLLSTAILLLLLGAYGGMLAASWSLPRLPPLLGTRFPRQAPLALAGAFLLFLAIDLPLSQALLIGGDDAFELGKAQLLHRRPDLAERLGNDQPWLHTLLMAALFRGLGEDAAIPRGATLLWTLGLTWACFRLLGNEAGWPEKLLFLAFFFTSTLVLSLSASAMLEMPAFATALCAVAISMPFGGGGASWRPVAAGLLLAAAAHIKLTALMVAPAWAMTLWLGKRELLTKRWILLLFGGFLLGGLALAWICPLFP